MTRKPEGAVVYEVNIDLEAAIRADYLAWLDAHVAEICALPGFVGAQVLEVTDPPPAPGRANLCVQYRLTGPDALGRYLAEHAPRLRAEGVERFGTRFSASRRVLAAPNCSAPRIGSVPREGFMLNR